MSISVNLKKYNKHVFSSIFGCNHLLCSCLAFVYITCFISTFHYWMATLSTYTSLLSLPFFLFFYSGFSPKLLLYSPLTFSAHSTYPLTSVPSLSRFLYFSIESLSCDSCRMVSALRGLNTCQESVCVSDFKRVTILVCQRELDYFPFLVVNTPVWLVSLNGTQIGQRKVFWIRLI